ncbi:MAG TPA: DsbE family thiol:disulfide interchange protein [Caulobacteraceae bacterium]|nr:DsbE family thiol:disulfide interchange protein [Caulobacteraceae bacterium]
MKRWLAVIPLVVLAAGALMFWGKSLHREVQYQPTELVGQATPDVTLTPLRGGEPVSLKTAAQGRPVLINVFGSWCAACVVEHPLLVDLNKRGLPVIGVAWRDKPEKTQAFLNSKGDPYTQVLMDPDGQAAIGLGITAAPESFLVDSKGQIIFKQTGPITPEVADLLIAKSKGA